MCLPVTPYKVEREWESSGLKCAVVMATEAGHRCGYVRVPPSHPFFGKNYDDLDVEVHGGLTFCEEEPCAHEDGQGFWFGFDCAHAGDAPMDPDLDPATLSPVARRVWDVHQLFPIPSGYEVYRSQEYVERECENLARQFAAAAA